MEGKCYITPIKSPLNGHVYLYGDVLNKVHLPPGTTCNLVMEGKSMGDVRSHLPINLLVGLRTRDISLDCNTPNLWAPFDYLQLDHASRKALTKQQVLNLDYQCTPCSSSNSDSLCWRPT